MLKIKDLIEKLGKFNKETEIRFRVNDREVYSDLSTITFTTWVDDEFEDEVVLEIYDNDYLDPKIGSDKE